MKCEETECEYIWEDKKSCSLYELDIIALCPYNNKGGDMKTKQEIQEAIDEYDTAIDFEQDEAEKDKLKAQRMALQWVLEDSRKV